MERSDRQNVYLRKVQPDVSFLEEHFPTIRKCLSSEVHRVFEVSEVHVSESQGIKINVFGKLKF